MRSTWVHTTLLTVFVLGGNVASSFAQEVPWDVFSDDPVSGSVCDVVNAGNLEVVVLSDTGELVVVTEDDYVLDEAAFVDTEGVYFFEGIPLGRIAFADDGDGFRTLWLLDLGDYVLDLDPDTGEPIFTDHFPDEFVSVPCDAFELWDDDDFDDVSDEFDDCPNTPSGAVVNNVGCEIVVVEPPPVTVVQPPPVFITCGNFSALTMALTFGALVTLRLARRRYT